MTRYAEGTQVSSESSRLELERTLTRFGATAFTYGWQAGAAAIQFEKAERRIRFVLRMPDPQSREFTHTPERRVRRSEAARSKAYEQAVRERWRALVLIVKAKLAAIEAGVVTFDEEFVGHIVLPSGRTVAEDVLPAVEHAYATGQVAPLQIEGGRS